MKGRTKGLLAAAVVAAVLAAAFWYGGGAPGLQGWNPAPAETAPVSPEPSAPVTISATRLASASASAALR